MEWDVPAGDGKQPAPTGAFIYSLSLMEIAAPAREVQRRAHEFPGLRAGEKLMQEQDSGKAMAALAEATTIQTNIAHQRLDLTWGHIVFALLLEVLKHIENQEALAYEDKVAAQISVLHHGSAHLWHLQRELARTCRLLRDHQRQLKHLEAT
jgi:hypothetical protein